MLLCLPHAGTNSHDGLQWEWRPFGAYAHAKVKCNNQPGLLLALTNAHTLVLSLPRLALWQGRCQGPAPVRERSAPMADVILQP